jgi:hypothetical protein
MKNPVVTEQNRSLSRLKYVHIARSIRTDCGITFAPIALSIYLFLWLL